MALIKIIDAFSFFFFFFKIRPLEKNSCQIDLNIKRNVLKGVRERYLLTDFCFSSGQRKEKMLERIGGKGVEGGERGKKKVHKGVCNGYAINYCIRTSITLIDMHLPLIGKWDSCSLQPCLAPKWQSKTMSFRSYKSGWGESSTDNFHAELFKKGNINFSAPSLKRLSPAVVLSAPNLHCGDGQCTVSPPEGHQLDNHPTYPITIPSLIIFKRISKTRDIWVSASICE